MSLSKDQVGSLNREGGAPAEPFPTYNGSVGAPPSPLN